MRRVIGIDFGTSTTYMNVKRYNGEQPDGDIYSYMPVVFNYGESSGYVATIIRENSDGSFDFGEKAAEPLEGARIHTEIKMRLESPNEEQRMEARRITKAFFRFLYETYVQQAGNLGGAGDEEETVVSYPVKWQKETAQFMLEAAREAGFQHVSGMDEAEAAVAAVVSQSGDGRGVVYGEKPGYLLLIDMGAGTTDLVVCRYHRGEKGLEIEMVANWPQDAREPTFGGREIDTVLEQYIEAYLERALNPALAPQAHVIAAAPGQAKMWKERNVSVTLGAGKEVNTCAYIGTYRTMGMLSGEFPAFGREKFETFLEDGLKEYVRLVKGCLDEAARCDESFASEGLDLVILTGGHSAWYFAREILTGAMEGWLGHPALSKVRENPYRVVSLPNPQSTVALGLVYSGLHVQSSEKEVLRQENSQQKVGSGTVSGATENIEAVCFDQARMFLPEKAKGSDVKYARIRLGIPENEDILYTEGRQSENSDPGIYAVAESGIYLQGPFGEKHRLPWTEFVNAEWADCSFAAPSWRNENRWKMSVPLVVTYKKGPLADLHARLQEMGLPLKEQLPQQEVLDRPLRPEAPEKKEPTVGQDTADASAQQEQRGSVSMEIPENRSVSSPYSDGMCKLLIARKGLTKATVKYVVEVDGNERYQLGFGAKITIPVKAGRHTLGFTFPNRDDRLALMEFDVSGDMDMNLKVTEQGFKRIFTLTEGAKIIGSAIWKKYKRP